ncbi:GAF domain-containing sensor histidine kinase [Candidatus Uhrbacteria bacterium]|nr:GAF domain-containing sensor histidine kinase [Candidatus Uhrbacteria bacterium]
MQRLQIKFILFGIAISIIGGSTNYFLWYDIPIRPYGNVFASTFAILTAYAILRHRLLDIKVVARRYVVYFASVATIAAPAFVLQFLLKPYVGAYGWLIDIAILVAGISVFTPLKNYYYNFSNRYLFSSLYDTKKVIRDLSDKLRSTIKAEEVYQHISQTLTDAFHTRGIALLTYDEKKKNFHLSYQRDFEKCSRELTVSKGLTSYLLNTDEPLLLSDIPKGVAKMKEISDFRSCGVAIINPLNLKDRLIGIMLLSDKESDEAYNEEDIQVLNVVGTQAAIAIENALSYEEIKRFNITLQKKIADATRKLKLQNEELQKVDKMKSEFISIASHQLRTPLTATKWALEFLAKGKKGKLTKQEAETIHDLRTSNDRLIKLVNELLNVSRLEESRVRIDPKSTDVTELLKGLVHEFMPIAEKMKQKIVEQYDHLPLINLDEGLITKSLHNFISNGIKYNKEGGTFIITAKKRGKEALLTFQDHGIGIPKAEQPNIFKKFYRATNASASHTEGTGLGMYIAKSAIELSGGSVRFESVEGKGTTFYVSLPLSGSPAREGEKSLS